MPDFSLIIVAGGSGSRMKADRKKAFLEVAGDPLLLHSVLAFHGLRDIGEIVVVLPKHEMKILSGSDDANFDMAELPDGADILAKKLRDAGVKRLVVGGARRQDSVLNGLWATSDDFEFVMIHDAARPFVTDVEVETLMARTRAIGAAILAHPVRDTLKRVEANKVIKETVSRAGLWSAQTPQGFNRQKLLDAYGKFNKQDVTDDAELAAVAGMEVAVVQGSAANFKITTPSDLDMAEAVLALTAAKNGNIRPASVVFRKLPGGDTIFDIEPESP